MTKQSPSVLLIECFSSIDEMSPGLGRHCELGLAGRSITTFNRFALDASLRPTLSHRPFCDSCESSWPTLPALKTLGGGSVVGRAPAKQLLGQGKQIEVHGRQQAREIGGQVDCQWLHL